MSALPPKATSIAFCGMSDGPIAGSCSPSKGSLFDHLVGCSEQRRRNCEAERLCSLEVDHQLVLVRRLHREVGRLLTFKNTVDVIGRLPVLIDQIGAGMGLTRPTNQRPPGW